MMGKKTRIINVLRNECEQLQVQLAGCSVVALGGTSPSQIAQKGDFGWSPAYQDVLDLRTKYDTLNPKSWEIMRTQLDMAIEALAKIKYIGAPDVYEIANDVLEKLR